MRLLSIVGARPQFMKVAPFARSLERYTQSGHDPVEHVIVHTGQHYDVSMSEVFFEELQIPRATFNLDVGSGLHGIQTGRMLEKIEQVLLETHPDVVIIYGDTNSTVAGALAAAKLHLPIAHVESGLRSFNRRMPEEINRVVADHVSDFLFAPTPTAMENLRNEGLGKKAAWTGDIMYDAVLFYRGLATRQSKILERLVLQPESYGVVTVHRADNTNEESRLENLLATFNDIAAGGLPLIFPVHPRTAKLLSMKFPAWSAHSNLRLIEPVGYLDMLNLVDHARLILTDSGGLQKEAFFLERPCITLREETEWMETVQEGGNILVGVEPDRIWEAVSMWESRRQSGRRQFAEQAPSAFGHGNAADTMRDLLIAFS